MLTHDVQNRITVGAFTATLDDWLLLEPAYRLPDGALWQLYVPGEKHLVGYGLYQRDEGSTWAEGDVYLANESVYATMQPDTTPDVLGFEADLIAAFGGDYLAINSLYSGWPLFKDAIEAFNWTLADLLLTNAYVTYEITTETYTAIIAAAQANYIPMALQGRPGLMPLNLIDTVTLLAALTPDSPQTDTVAAGLDDVSYIQYGLDVALDTATVAATEISNMVEVEPVTPVDSATVDSVDGAVLPVSVTVLADEALTTQVDEAAPSLVMT